MAPKRATPTLRNLIKDVQTSNLIIKPAYNNFLLKNPDVVYDDWVVERIRDVLSTKPRVRSGSFSSSAAGTCPRKQMLAFLGIPKYGVIDPQLANIFSDGRWRHLRLQANMLQAGILDDIEIPLNWPGQFSKGSMDGIGTVPDDHARVSWREEAFGAELKGTNSYVYATIVKDGPDKFIDQVSRYFLSGGYELFSIFVENKNTQETAEFVFEADQVRVEEQREELKELNRFRAKEQLPPRLPDCQQRKGDVFNGCDYGGKDGPCIKIRKWPV